MMKLSEFKWPKKGDTAFKPTLEPPVRFEVEAFVIPRSVNYTLGFRLAAERIIDSARQEMKGGDLLFFPVAYLYRHYLELMLKDLVRLGVRIGSISITDDRLEKHDLHKLWNSARELIEKTWPQSDRNDTDVVERVILKFHHLDESGQAFRYARAMDGTPHLDDAPHRLSLDNMQPTMDAVAHYLEGSETGVCEMDPGDIY